MEDPMGLLLFIVIVSAGLIRVVAGARSGKVSYAAPAKVARR